MSNAERQEAIRLANQNMKGYVETRILAKQGKLKSKSRGPSAETRSANKIQMALAVTLAAAFLGSPFLGKKIAQDPEFREKYVPDWYDFRVRSPESAWTRQELHEQLVEVEQDMRERAIRGDFTPEKLEELKRSMEPRSDLTEEDLQYAKKYGWGRIHPGIDDDDDDDDDE
jgi:tryptophan 2,3-dioxygenase